MYNATITKVVWCQLSPPVGMTYNQFCDRPFNHCNVQVEKTMAERETFAKIVSFARYFELFQLTSYPDHIPMAWV